MMADIRILQEQSQQLQTAVSALAASIASLTTRIDEQSSATRKGFADQKVVIDTVSGDLRVVREKIDDNGVRVGSLSQEVEALRQSVTALAALPRMTPDAPAPDGAGSTPSATAGGGTAPASVVTASPQKLLDGAMADYYAGQYDLAVTGLEAYVRAFPQSPQAATAQAHVGHARMQQGRYDEAVTAYDLVIRTYPKSPDLPDVLVRKGTALQSLKQTGPARDAFTLVLKNYPESIAATVAQQRLQELQTQKP